jgi:hypothetical protein
VKGFTVEAVWKTRTGSWIYCRTGSGVFVLRGAGRFGATVYDVALLRMGMGPPRGLRSLPFSGCFFSSVRLLAEANDDDVDPFTKRGVGVILRFAGGPLITGIRGGRGSSSIS